MVQYTINRINEINALLSKPWRAALIHVVWILRSIGEVLLVVYILTVQGFLNSPYFYSNAPTTYAITNVAINVLVTIMLCVTHLHARVEAHPYIVFTGMDHLAYFEHYSILREICSLPLIYGIIYTVACVLNVAILYPERVTTIISASFLLTAWSSSVLILITRGVLTVLFGRYVLGKREATFKTTSIFCDDSRQTNNGENPQDDNLHFSSIV
jgi:hypothetical protein